MLRLVAVLTVLAALAACSTSDDDHDTFARLRGEEVVDATSANATVVERTASPCGGTAREDGWAEVTWAFTSPDQESVVLEQFKSKVTTAGWSAASGSDYGHNVLLFKKGESQVRLHPAAPDFPYQVILESPC